jgi:hypothetical protein
MEGQSKDAGDVFYDSMHSALDRSSDEFAKLFTGQKTSFGKMFQSLGQEMVKESTKSLEQKGLGKLGTILFPKKPKDIEAHKPSGNPGDAVHVWVDNSGAPADATPAGNFQNLAGVVGAGSSGLAGLLKGLFSSGSGSAASGGLSEAVSSSITFMAGGGDAEPGNIYRVAEAGEGELITPRNASTITPLSKMADGGGDTYHIDARGADLGAANRISRALESTHQSAVATAVRANAQRSWRVPQRAKA